MKSQYYSHSMLIFYISMVWHGISMVWIIQEINNIAKYGMTQIKFLFYNLFIKLEHSILKTIYFMYLVFIEYPRSINVFW